MEKEEKRGERDGIRGVRECERKRRETEKRGMGGGENKKQERKYKKRDRDDRGKMQETERRRAKERIMKDWKRIEDGEKAKMRTGKWKIR